MSGDVRWLRCPESLGVALWRTLRDLLGQPDSGVGVGASYTSDDHVITEVWCLDVPILKCETWYRDVRMDEEGITRRGVGEHAYYLPAREECDHADHA